MNDTKEKPSSSSTERRQGTHHGPRLRYFYSLSSRDGNPSNTKPLTRSTYVKLCCALVPTDTIQIPVSHYLKRHVYLPSSPVQGRSAPVNSTQTFLFFLKNLVFCDNYRTRLPCVSTPLYTPRVSFFDSCPRCLLLVPPPLFATQLLLTPSGAYGIIFPPQWCLSLRASSAGGMGRRRVFVRSQHGSFPTATVPDDDPGTTFDPSWIGTHPRRPYPPPLTEVCTRRPSS